MKTKVIFLLFILLQYTLHTFATRYDGNSYVLFQGGPSMTFQSDGVVGSGDKCSSGSNIICESNVYLYEFSSPDKNVSLDYTNYEVNCNSQTQKFGYAIKATATTSNIYSTTVYEHKRQVSAWWDRNSFLGSWSPKNCSVGNSVIGSFQISVVEPVKFKEIDEIRNICKTAAVINLRSYLNDNTRGKIYIDGIALDNDLLDPSKFSGGLHEIFVKHTYNNGAWESKHETINIIIPPAVDAGSDFSLCADFGLYFLSGNPSGGTWSGTGVFNGTFSTKDVDPGVYELTYKKADQYSCVASDKVLVTVNALPLVSNSIKTQFCNKDNPLDLTLVTPVGGVWKGQGISGTVFNPSLAGVGDWTITLEVTNTKGCKNTDSRIVKVKPNPDIFVGNPIQVCEGASAIDITGDSPLGGIYTGTGVTGTNKFDPKNLVPSTYQLTYTVTQDGCSSQKVKGAIINPKPALTVLNPSLTVCPEQTQLSLNNVTPINGIYSGNNVTGNIFNVKAAASGTHEINYFYTDANSCSNTTKFTVSIIPTVVVDAGADFEICENDNIIKLSGNFPEGGAWTGAGVGGDRFDPGTAGIGSYVIKYVVDYGVGCQGFDTRTVKVKEKPTVFSGNVLSICENAAPVKLNTGLPVGGYWTGPGVEGEYFNPSTVAAGALQIKYNYKSPDNGCSNTINRNVVVNEMPFVAAGTNFYTCINNPSISLSGIPSDAIWTGPGVNGNLFNPAVAGPGIKTLYLTKKNAFQCTGKDSLLAIVNSLPEVEAGSDQKVCKNIANVNLVGMPSGGTWLGEGITGNTFEPGKAIGSQITAKYSYTDQNGCTGTASRILTILPTPKVTITGENNVCENTPILSLKGGLPSGGNWVGRGIINNSFYPSLTGSGSQIVYYSYTDNNNCTDSLSTYVNVMAAPSIDAGSDTVFCKGTDYYDFSTYSAIPSGGVWSGADIKNNIINPSSLSPGRFILKYSYTDKSTKCSSEDSIAMEVQQGLAAPIITGDNILCAGDTVKLEAMTVDEDVDTKYYWYKQGENAAFTEGKRIQFLNTNSVTIFCEALTKVKKCPSLRGKTDLVNDTPQGQIIASKSSILMEDNIKFSFTGNGNSFEWSFGDGEYSTERSPYHYYYKHGSFDVKVRVKTENGCTADFENKGMINVTGEDISIVTDADIDEKFKTLDGVYFNYYPNPASSDIRLEFNKSGEYSVEIMDLSGKIQKVFTVQGSDNLDISDLPAGIFIVTVKSDSFSKVVKIEKI